jgi:hypothetical protein
MFWALISTTVPPPPPPPVGAAVALGAAEPLGAAEGSVLGIGVGDGAGAYVQPGVVAVHAATTNRDRPARRERRVRMGRWTSGTHG